MIRERKKYITASGVLVCAALLFSGCGQLESYFDKKETDDKILDVIIAEENEDVKEPETTVNPDGYKVDENTEDISSNPDMGQFRKLPEEEVLSAKESSEGLFYYEKLSESEKTTYAEILTVLRHRAEKALLTTLSSEETDIAFKAVANDYPEIYFVDGYTYTLYLLGDVPSKLLFSGSYTMSADMIAQNDRAVEEYTDAFLNSMSAEGIDKSDDYNVIKYTYEYIIKNTDYDKSAPNNQNIISVMTGKKSVCSGYAKATQYLLNKCGIYASIVLGNVREGTEAHSWNLVSCNGSFYYLDTTWGDASYAYEEENDKGAAPPVNYDYLLVTEADILRTHIFDSLALMPYCNSTADNYYVREDLLFYDVDAEHLSMAFDKAYEENREYIMLKMSDEAVYDNMWEHLLNKQHIFDYLKGKNDSVSYSENKDGLYFIFYI